MIRNRHLDSFSLKCQSFTIHITFIFVPTNRICFFHSESFGVKDTSKKNFVYRYMTVTAGNLSVTYRYMTVRSFRYSASKNFNFAILPLTFYIVCHRLFDHWEKFRELMNFFQAQHKLCRAYLAASTVVSWRKIYSIKLFGQF